MRECLTPLPKALEDMSDTLSAQHLKSWMPSTHNGVRCITDAQKLNIVYCVIGLDREANNNLRAGLKILDLARNIYNLAVKDCLNCSTDNCHFRDNKPEE